MSDDGRVLVSSAGLPSAVASDPFRAEMLFACAPSGETYLRRQYAAYPFHFCRPFYLPDDPTGMATLYMQSCSGGIFQDDDLRIDVLAEEGACAHVTSQASTIVHSMERGEAVQTASLDVRAGAFLEYLPDPLILFPRSRLSAKLHIRLHETATVIACDSFLLHDPAGGSAVFDRLVNETVVETSTGSVLALDRFEIGGDRIVGGLPGVTGKFRAHGTMLVLNRERPAAALVEAVRQGLEGTFGIYAGVSALPGEAGAWIRFLAEDGIALRAGFQRGWSAARRILTGQAPRARRK